MRLHRARAQVEGSTISGSSRDRQRLPIGLITLKNRTLTPLAQLFIENVRALAKLLAKRQRI
jgi:hypothetical protein